MKGRHALALAVFGLTVLPSAGWADRITRSVDRRGVPTITIHGQPRAANPVPASAPAKEFQVYELEGEGAPPEEQEQPPVIVIIPSPPPIAPNPAAYGYGYWGYGFGPSPLFPGCYPYNFGPTRPVNYQAPPVNYQAPPVNYQAPPVNYQPQPLPPPNQRPRGHFRRH